MTACHSAYAPLSIRTLISPFLWFWTRKYQYTEIDYLPLSHLTCDSDYNYVDHYYYCIYTEVSRLKRYFSDWEEKSIAPFYENYLQITSNNFSALEITQSEIAPNWKKKCSQFKLCCSLYHVRNTYKHMVLLIILRSVTSHCYIYHDTMHIKLWKLHTLIRICSLPGKWQYFIWDFLAKTHA